MPEIPQLLFGTLLFSDSMTRPKHLDNSTVDWAYPIQGVPNPSKLRDTRGVRKCYRSKRISLDAVRASGTSSVNTTVFLHNTDKLVPGAVRIYLWRKAQGKEYLASMSGSGWAASSGSFTHTTSASTPLSSSNTFLTGKHYQIDWNVNVPANHGSVGIVFGGVEMQATNPANVVTNRITASGSARVYCATATGLVVTPYADPNNSSMFNGTVSFSVVDPYDLRPVLVGNEDFLDMVCTTRSVTKGMAIASTQVDSMFDAMQVVVMQPCSGVSVYVGPPTVNPGPSIGPGIA